MSQRLTPSSEHEYLFVTGKLAEPMVREIVRELAQRYSFRYTVEVMPITVAALMSAAWLMRHLRVSPSTTHVIVPGYFAGQETELATITDKPIIVGPKDCRDLADIFGGAKRRPNFDQYSIEIIAEINHAPRMNVADVANLANRLRADGADRIDVGADPARPATNIGDYVAALVSDGHSVSIDSFDANEVQTAVDAGASLVLSVNSTNRDAAPRWGCEVVAIPDTPTDLASLNETIQFLENHNVPYRLDPILEPIGTGFAQSLVRYAIVRQQFPHAKMMMGIGNLTELTDVDSAGVNLLLLGICEELKIESVLTTQVINWARSSVRECDIARRLCHFAIKNQIPPKRLSDELVMLRDPKLHHFSMESLAKLAGAIKDNNYRLFADEDAIHLLSRNLHLSDPDPFALFEQLLQQPISENVDAGHAFYLGFEMAKAALARQLGKQYSQDQSLRWGFIAEREDYHRLQKRKSKRERKP